MSVLNLYCKIRLKKQIWFLLPLSFQYNSSISQTYQRAYIFSLWPLIVAYVCYFIDWSWVLDAFYTVEHLRAARSALVVAAMAGMHILMNSCKFSQFSPSLSPPLSSSLSLCFFFPLCIYILLRSQAHDLFTKSHERSMHI